MSSAVIYQNIAAATPFVAAIGIGAGLGFYLYFRYKSGCEEKERAREAARDELSNIEYIIRRDLEALPDELKTGFAQVRQELAGRTAEVMAALDANDPAKVEQLLAGLANQSFEIRRALADASCAGEETAGLIRNLGEQIAGLIPACRKEDQAALSAEMHAALADVDTTNAIARLEALRSQARRSARIAALLGAGTATGVEERFIQQATPDTVRAEAQLAEIERFHLLLKGYDATVYAELQPVVAEAEHETLPQRLGMIRDMVKLRYGKVKQAASATSAYCGYIAGLESQLAGMEGSAALLERAASLKSQRYISREEYTAFAADAARHMASLREEAILIADMQEKLSGLGYNLDDTQATELTHDQPIYFDTSWEEYKVLVRIGANGELVTRLARIVATEREKAETTDYQRQRDQEVAHKWCHDFDSFIGSLQQKGYAFKTVMRKEPEDEGVICIVDAARAARQGRSVHVAIPEARKEQSVV